jgi:hypothetical protein
MAMVSIRSGCVEIGIMTGEIFGYDSHGRELFDYRWDWDDWKKSRTQADVDKLESQGIMLNGK